MAVGDELAVGVEDRVIAEAGGEDVGLGHRQLEFERQQVEVALHELIDGLVESQAVGRALLVFLEGQFELAVL